VRDKDSAEKNMVAKNWGERLPAETSGRIQPFVFKKVVHYLFYLLPSHEKHQPEITHPPAIHHLSKFENWK
jgi:hypothetical protein